jgi:hypothetical protein
MNIISTKLQWIKYEDGSWCNFERVDLSYANLKGVYCIWYNGNPGRVVRWGQGHVQSRVTQHRLNPEILAYKNKELLVTWASVAQDSLNGVEKYLSDAFPPLVGERFPEVLPLKVNSPWG